MKILVTDGDNRAALAITRSLGRERHQIIVGSESYPNLAATSRYCSTHFIYPDPQRDPEGFQETIEQTTKRLHPDILIPVSEITTLLVTQQKRFLEEFTTVPFPNHDIVQCAADKRAILKHALELGIPIPETVFVDSPVSIDQIIPQCQHLGFPVVIKPSRSRVLRKEQWHGTITRYAVDSLELETILNSIPSEEYPLLLQERIVGPGVGVFALMDHDKLMCTFSHRRIREKPPSGGVSVLRESVPVNSELRKRSEKLLRAIRWQSVAMVEFKKDNRNGDYRLMEINGRFWGSLQLAIDAGVNFPLLVLKSVHTDGIKPQFDYHVGVKTRWFWGDFDALLSRLFKPRRTLNLPTGFPNKWEYFKAFMRLKQKGMHYEVLNPDDLHPWFLESRRWFRSFISR
jgi:predicted ATP-grasp superfamily ATP-dependent carboligase